MAGVVDSKKKKVAPTSKVPETGPGSRDAGSYGTGLGAIPRKIGNFFKGASGLDDDARARLFPATVPAKNASLSGYSDVSGLQKAEANAGLRPKMPVGESSSYGSNKNTPVKSPVDDKLSIDRFDPNKLTLGNGPDGKVGMFKDGKMLDPSKTRLSGGNLGGTPLPVGQSPFFMKSQAAQGLVPQPGTASAIPGMQQNPAVGMPGGNWTGMLNQDDAIFKAQMANVGQDYRIGTGNPAFANDPMMAQSLARRDSLQASLDTFNRQNPLRSGASVGDIISNRASTFNQRKEIEDLNKDIFGRSDLGTKLQMAMLDSLTKKNISQGDNQTALAKQAMENQGQWDTRSMMEGNENLRHAASLQAGVGQPKPGEDPFAKVGPNAIQEVLKAQLAANPDMTIEDITSLVNNLSTRLSGRPGGQLASVLQTIK